MQEIYRKLIESIGEDPDREGLCDTSKRAAAAMKFLTKGYAEDAGSVINGALFESHSDDMIVVKDIELYSLCEHHILPFIGKCHVAYIPEEKVLGLSKIARVVEVYARRLQIQERLTRQIADAILEHTGARGVGVVVEAQHLCMMMRGVEKQNSVMKTSSMLGVFRDHNETRMEFLNLIS